MLTKFRHLRWRNITESFRQKSLIKLTRKSLCTRSRNCVWPFTNCFEGLRRLSHIIVMTRPTNKVERRFWWKKMTTSRVVHVTRKVTAKNRKESDERLTHTLYYQSLRRGEAFLHFRQAGLAPLIHLLVYDTLVTEGNVAVTP